MKKEYFWVFGDGMNLQRKWHLAAKVDGKFYFHNMQGGASAKSWPSDLVQGPVKIEAPEEVPA